MTIEIGQIKAIFRYPVKSMGGEGLDTASLGWHGLDGDRHFAFRRIADRGGFPWLTAGRLPELILFKPFRRDPGNQTPTHVRTPEGEILELRGEELRAEISQRRCVMINFDPETAQTDPSILKSVVRLNQHNAGVYGTVVRAGNLSVGQKIYFDR